MKKHNTKKYLIILGGGILQLPLIKQAIEMNFIPIVFDYNKNAEAFKIDEVVKIVVSTQDIEKATKISKKLSKKYSIHGVLTSGTEERLQIVLLFSMDIEIYQYDKKQLKIN